MVAIKGRKSSNKNPPILSHEFFIQNHADIVSCVAMVFVIGLMIQVTSAWAYIFVAVQHNVNVSLTEENVQSPPKYTTGWKDGCAVFFYFLITIVLHAAIQECFFDKISKRLYLSKSKLAKFNESSERFVFYVASIAWGIAIIVRDNLILNITSLWEDYPGTMSFSLKLFFIGQLSYWLHCYPELYFQRVKKEDMSAKCIFAAIGLLFTFAAYFLNLQHAALILLVLHFTGEAFKDGANLVDFIYQKEKMTKAAFSIANSTYVLTRVLIIGFSALIFGYGLEQADQSFDYASGNFNIPAVRYSVLATVLIFQTYLLYKFVKQQLEIARESQATVVTKLKSKQKSKSKKESKKSAASNEDDSADDNKKNLRNRSTPKSTPKAK